jgi:hypothetical protein
MAYRYYNISKQENCHLVEDPSPSNVYKLPLLVLLEHLHVNATRLLQDGACDNLGKPQNDEDVIGDIVTRRGSTVHSELELTTTVPHPYFSNFSSSPSLATLY